VSLVASPPSHGESAAVGSSPTGLILLAHQSVPPAPGRETSVGQPAPAPAPAHGEAAPGGSGLLGVLPLFIMIVPVILLMVFSNRSQQKKQAALLSNLKKGDKVLTDTGLVGRLVQLGDRYATLEIAPGTKVDVLRNRLAGLDNPETQAASEKK
jgi:preprotein translocase subunit YajC